MVINMKKVVKLFVIGSALLFFLLLIVPIEYDIETTLYALKISGANMDTDEVAIQIMGRYTWRFLRRDRFRGNFMIEGYSTTKSQNYWIDIDVGKSTHDWLEYRRQGGTSFSWHTVGQIYTSANFRNFVILPFESDHIKTGQGYIELSGETITAIVYPAAARNDAVQSVNRMVRNLSPPMN